MMNHKSMLVLMVKVAVLAVTLVVVQGIGAQFLPGSGVTGEVAATDQAPPPSSGFMGLVLSIALVQTVALAYPIVRSRWHGWRLALATFLLFFGTVTFMSQIELLVYLEDRWAPGMLSGLFLMGLFNAAVFSPILVVALGKWKAEPGSGDPEQTRPGMSGATWAWKIALGSTVFLACYYLFGYFVAWKSAAVRDYYGGSDPGTFFAQMSKIMVDTPFMIPLQFVRGLLWVLLALIVIRMMKGRWWESGLAVSLLFATPAIYLLYPNPLMPHEVRMVHLAETFPYQFLFGWFMGWLFGRTSLTAGPSHEPASHGVPHGDAPA